MGKLPDKQHRILEFIKSQHAETGMYPSVREIAAHMDFKSTNTVDYHLRRMEAGGLLERGGRRARSFTALSEKTGRVKSGAGTMSGTAGSARNSGIPLLGRVAAGEPILAEQHFEGMINFDTYFRCDEETFALKVAGDSMVDVGIVDGDMVIVRQGSKLANGEIGVAVVEGEATVKRIYDEGKVWRLQPENATMQPIVVDKEKEFSIAGKVVGVMRKL